MSLTLDKVATTFSEVVISRLVWCTENREFRARKTCRLINIWKYTIHLDFIQLPFEYGRFPGVGLYPLQHLPDFFVDFILLDVFLDDFLLDIFLGI